MAKARSILLAVFSMQGSHGTPAVQSGKALVGMAQSCSTLLVLFQLYAGAQAQLPNETPKSVDGRLDVSVGAIVARFRSKCARIGRWPRAVYVLERRSFASAAER